MNEWCRIREGGCKKDNGKNVGILNDTGVMSGMFVGFVVHQKCQPINFCFCFYFYFVFPF